MQDKYTISDLPVDIMLPGLNGKSRFYTVLGWLQVLLLIVCVIAVLVIMFGPDEIMVDKRIGVTFVQFFFDLSWSYCDSVLYNYLYFAVWLKVSAQRNS